MIPRHRPPFGLASLAKATVGSCLDRQTIDDLEQVYAQWLKVEHAVWIPSARYGIARAIQQNLAADGTVHCPAFNCGAVFHAAQESGRAIEFVDCADNSFLMDTAQRPSPNSAVILSEMFGRRFSKPELSRPLANLAAMRIFDMAMSIPNAADMQRMREQDISVLSFGLGKSLYAGWGGMATTHSHLIANSLREQRDLDLQSPGLKSRITCHTKIWARTAAHLPSIYGPLRRSRKTATEFPESTNFCTTSPEWCRNATSLNLRLAFDNLATADQWADQRRSLCESYHLGLNKLAGSIHFADAPTEPLSHFAIRVPGDSRETIKRHLWNMGIDTGTLFPFPNHLCQPTSCPNANAASAEVLNLPLSNQLTESKVNQICKAVANSITMKKPAQDAFEKAA